MPSNRKRTFIGTALITVGALLLLVSNNILVGWGNVWPLGLVVVGGFLLKRFAEQRVPATLFWGVTSLLLGLFFLSFTTGAVAWDHINALWPIIPMIGGMGMMAVSTTDRYGAGTLIGGIVLLTFSTAGLLYEFDFISNRVAAPFVRLWPIVLVIAGAVILRMGRDRDRDPDLEAVREVMEGAGGPRSQFPHLEDEITEKVQSAGGPDDAVRALVNALSEDFTKYTWVGVYRVAGDILTLGENDFVGNVPDYQEIKLTEGICGACATARETIIVPDVCNDPRYLACSPEVKSEIVVPILHQRELIGVLDIDGEELDAFGEDDKVFLQNLVRRTSGYIARQPKKIKS